MGFRFSTVVFLFLISLVSAVSGFSVDGGSVSVSDTIVYGTAYFSIDGTSWTPFSLSGLNSIGDWLIGSAGADVDLTSAKQVAVYSCSWNNGWDCHRNDWQVKTISLNDSMEKTFSEELNPTGDPIGGGPGYSGEFRTNTLGLSGKGIYTAEDSDHVVSTVSELLEKMVNYYDESTGTTVTPSNPAQSGEVIFVDDDIDLTGYHSLSIPAGVTLASDRGYDNGDGTYRQGALLKTRNFYFKKNSVVTDSVLQDAGADVRITGLRIMGPSSWAQKANVGETQRWQGGALGIKHATPAGSLEVDNCEIYGWDNWAIWLYRINDDYIHHNWIHHSRREGFGYGLWPGTPQTDYVETSLVVRGNMFASNRHTFDGRAAAREQLIVDFSNNVIADFHQRNTINDHPTTLSGGTSVAGWKKSFKENLFLDTPGITVSAPNDGGYLNIKDNWLINTNQCSLTWIAGHGFCIYDSNHADYNPNYKDLFADPIGDIATGGNHFNNSSRTLPITSVSVSDATTIEDTSVTLTFNSYDPDGHKIVFHEVIWGDGKDVIDPTHRTLTFASSISHTYTEPGTYFVRVRAFNEYGVPSEAVGKKIIVEPSNSATTFSAFIAPDWPFAVIQESGEDWTGYYEFNVKINGNTVWTKDAGNFDGWEHIVVDVSSILDQESTFTPEFEVVTLQTINDPDRTEPGEINFYLDDFDLFNFDQAHVRGSFYHVVDHTFDVENEIFNSQWNAAITPARKRDTKAGYGRHVYITHGGDSLGAKSSFTKTFNILGPPVLSVSEGEDSIFLSWPKVNVASGHEIRYGIESGNYNNLIDVNNTLSYLIENLQENTDYYIQARSYGPHRLDNSTVYSEWSDEVQVATKPLPEYLSRLQAAWSLDEASIPYNDSVNGDVHALTKGTAGSREAIIGNEAVFDGTSSLSAGKVSPMLLIGTNDYTVEMWVTPESVTSSYAGLFSDGGGGSNGDQGMMIALRSNGNIYAFLGTLQRRVNAVGGSVLDGQRHHIVVSFDRDDSIYLWVDGNLVRTSDISPYADEDLRPTGPIEISPSFAGRYVGAIDEVRVWNNRVLNQTNVDYLYNNGTGRSFDELAER